jgi:hypothetical protein
VKRKPRTVRTSSGSPANGWSLKGLARSLVAQEKHAEAAAVEEQFAEMWRGADVQITGSRP